MPSPPRPKSKRDSETHVTTSAPAMESSPLSKLPAELRNYIYGLVLAKPVTDIRNYVNIGRLVRRQEELSRTGRKPDIGALIGSSSSLFFTCHQMKAECLPIYLTVNRFRDDMWSRVSRCRLDTCVKVWLASLGLESLHALTDVTVAQGVHEMDFNPGLIESYLPQLISLTKTLPLRPKCLRLQLISFAGQDWLPFNVPVARVFATPPCDGDRLERFEQPTVIIGDVPASIASLESACSAATDRFIEFQKRFDLGAANLPQNARMPQHEIALRSAQRQTQLENYLQLTRARHGRLVETMVAEMGLSTATSTQLHRV